MQKKILLIASVLVVLVLVFAGCKKPNEKAEIVPTVTQEAIPEAAAQTGEQQTGTQLAESDEAAQLEELEQLDELSQAVDSEALVELSELSELSDIAELSELEELLNEIAELEEYMD